MPLTNQAARSKLAADAADRNLPIPVCSVVLEIDRPDFSEGQGPSRQPPDLLDQRMVEAVDHAILERRGEVIAHGAVIPLRLRDRDLHHADT